MVGGRLVAPRVDLLGELGALLEEEVRAEAADGATDELALRLRAHQVGQCVVDDAGLRGVDDPARRVREHPLEGAPEEVVDPRLQVEL